MRLKHQCNRLISLFLVFVMVIGMMPVHAHAASDSAVDAAVIFSDLHTSSSDYKESTVKGIMTAFKNAGLPVSSVTSGGDAFSVNADSTKYTGDPTKITGFIRTALGNNTIPVNYVWSDHDRYGTGIDQKSKLVYGAGNDGIYGTADDGNYYIYSLSMGDLCTYDRYNAGFNYTASSNNRTSKGFTATVPEAIANFKADTAALNKDRPLLIVSHQPLFDNRNDNGWAADWCDAINEVASEMDVAFFYGHNHKYDSGNDYYYAKGSTMPVAIRKLSNGSDWNYAYQTGSGWQYNNDLASVNKVLKFTHICAGYLAPSSTGSTSSTTREGTAMAVTIYDDSIRFTTYNSKGIFTGNYAVDKTVTREFAATEPELMVSGTASYFTGDSLDLTVSYKVGSNTENVTSKATLTGYNMNAAGDYTIQIAYGGLTTEYAITVREKTFRDAATGITAEVSVPGATGMTVNALSTDSQEFQAAAGLLSNCAAYDINLTNCTEAKISLPVPAGVTTPVVYHISNDGKTITRLDVTASAGSVSFTTGSFGAFIIGQQEITEDLEGSVVAGGTSYEEKTVYVRVDSFENGGKYLIVGEDKASSGNKIAYLNNSGSEGWATVSVNSNSITANGTTYSKGYIELSNANAVWTASGSASAGYTLSNNNRYIGGTDANTLKSASGDASKVTYDAAASRLKTASGTTRYLYYSTYGSENWKWSTSSSSSTSSRNMWIYKEVTVKVATSAAVTYTIQAENQHHVLSTNTLQLNYALLADGVAAELPSGGCYSFEVKNDGNGIIAGISDTGLITFNKAAGGCYVKIAYTWSEGTAYKYVKITTEVDPNACEHEYTAVTVKATCTKDGSITYTCDCGDSYVDIIKAIGHDYTSVVTAPTCTAEGYTTYTCSNCGHSYTADKVAALGHNYKSVVTAPTCTEKGYTTYTCTCGDTYVADEVKALGHDYKSVTVEATCTKDGSITYTCTCGDTYTEIIKATGHNHKSVVTAPTCTEKGYTTYTCACGDTYVADEVKALGHDYKSVTVEATCTKDGSITYTCDCGDSYVEVIKAIGHDYKSVVTAPTCTKDGYTTYTCSNCDHSYTADKVAALGHTYKSVVTAPTCTENGYTTYTCTCGDTYVANEVAALGHDYKSVTVEATCIKDGSVTYTCACGDSYVEVIKSLGHDYTSVVTAPTCTEEGFTTYTCTTCGHSEKGDKVAALGHDYKSATVEATCTENGSITYICHCGDTYTEVIKATGHNHKSVVTAPTCTENGYTTYTCHCGHSYVADEVKALGHKYESVTVDATCTEDGSVTYTCACGDTYTEVIKATGHDYKSVVTAPTCTEVGFTTYTCACGHSYVADEVAALGHTYKSVVTVPTCTEDGFTTYTCACGDSYVADEVAALGHTYKSVVTAPTCTVDGFTTFTCACGDSYVADEVAALGHTYKSVVTAPTCTEDGFTTYTCACGHSYVADEVAALGHTYKAVTKEATCTEDGSVTYTCACGNSYVEVIKAIGHDYKSVVTAPTCTKDGYTTYTCITCGDTHKDDQVAALGHKHESVTVDASCTEDGSVTYTCACGDTYTEVIKATGHNYKSVVTAPTCTEDGFTTYTCACGDTYVADEVKALGHDYKSVTVAATCTKDGSVAYTCACGDTYTEVIKAPGHNYKSVVIAPTCTAEGYTTYTCSNCDYSYTADEVKALGHIYEAVVTEPTNTKGGYTTYTCVCGDSYIGDETEALENSIVAGGTSYEEKTIYVRVDSFENGGKYVLIGEDNVSNGKPIAYLNNSGSEGWETVSINSGSVTANGTTYANGYIELNNAKAVWTASGSASAGYTLANNGRYIGGTDANTLKSSSSEAAKMVYDASAVRLKTASGTTRYLYYSTYGSENWKWATSINSSSSSRKMWIYKEVTVQIPTSAPATYTLETADVHHILTDYTAQLQYALLADGAATELPSGGSYSFQVSKDTNGIIAGISEQGLITFNNVAGSCFVKISYTWSAGSVYRYVKVTTELDPNACDHVYTSKTVDATCTENGYTIHTCTVCGDSYVTDEVVALGHNHKSVTVDATCTVDGSVTYTCACGDTYSEVIKATGHDYVCTEGEGCLIYACSACGDSYTEAVESAWVNLGKSYVLDTDGIEVGPEHKYVVVGGNQDYALTLNNGSISATGVKIQNNTLVLDPASIYEFYFVNNGSRERNTYLLTQDGSRGVYHVSSNISYGHDSKGYWYFGSSSNGSYQLYDYDNCNWYLNYGFAWGTDSVNRFAVSYNPQSVRLFKLTDGYVRLAGSLYQTVTDADGATVESVLNKLSLETSVDGVNVSGTSAVTADMVAWDHGFDSNTPGVYTATVTKDGIQIGTIKVTVTSKHTYKSEVVAATCTNEGYTSHSCTICGYSYVSNKVAALGHSYNCVESDGYLVYTCATCGDSYSEKAVTYTQVSSISSGSKYVLTLYANSKYYALSHENNQISVVEISVSNGEITSDISENLLWNCKDSKLSYENQGTTYYLYGKKSGPKNGTVSISTSSSSVTFKSNKLKIGTQYLYYSNGRISLSSSGTTTYAFIEN